MTSFAIVFGKKALQIIRKIPYRLFDNNFFILQELDWEVELTIVIGKEAKHVHVNTHIASVSEILTGFCHKNLPHDRNYIKRAHGVSPQFFSFEPEY